MGEGWSQTILHFPNGKQERTALHRGTYLGYIGRRQDAPYLLLSGYRCTECDAGPMIVVYSPAEGPLRLGLAKTYVWPGPIEEWGVDSTKVVATSQFFFGACISTDRDAIVQYMTVKDSLGRAHTSVSVSEVIGQQLEARELPITEVPLTGVLNRVRGGKCHEVPTRASSN